ncbi:hypothetical protein B566_EDAN011896 [Ephemera danica]|nr:hypothetical protein B566_EDAN011896 [Ephemera danica]
MEVYHPGPHKPSLVQWRCFDVQWCCWLAEVTMNNSSHLLGLTLADLLFSALVIGPAVVGYWRGTWLLTEYYVYPDNMTLSSWISLAIGCSVHLVLALVQGVLDKWVTKETLGVVKFLVVSRVYTAVFSFACVSSWRGVWQTLEHYTGTELISVLITTTAALLALLVMRTMRNLTSPPFAVVLDLAQGYFKFPTMFRVQPLLFVLQLQEPGAKDPTLHALDCVFSVLVVGSLVVIVWRGTWGILDHVLLPNNPDMSAWISLGIGYGVTAAGFALQVPARIACEKLSGAFRIIVADAYQFFCFCGTVNLWRGVWNLLNIYLLPGI